MEKGELLLMKKTHDSYQIKILFFQCPLCDKSFPRRTSLRIHQRNHKGPDLKRRLDEIRLNQIKNDEDDR